MWHKLKLVFMIVRWTYRFWSGRPMNGERKTNATFRRRATHSLDPSGTALRWEMLAGWERAAWRLGVSYVLLLGVSLGVLSLADRVVSLPMLLRPGVIFLLHLSVFGVLLAIRTHRRATLLHGYRIPILVRREKELLPEEELLQLSEEEQEKEEKPRKEWGVDFIEKDGRWEWEKEKVLPVARVVAPLLQVSWTEKEQRSAVHVPRNFREEGGGAVEVLLPAKFNGDPGTQKRIVSAVAGKLSMREPVARWEMEGSAPRLLISLPPAPPKLVLFDEVRHFFEAATPYNPFYGVIAGGEGLHIGMHSDTPHMALSAGSGAGKSEMIKVLIMQMLHWGWSVIILDWKNESQEWAKGLRGVRYYSTEEDIHDALVQVAEEIDWRKTHPKEDFTPMIVVCEEWSMTADLLSEYWSILRSTAETEERRSMPTRSPALTAAKKIVYTGRSLGVFQLLVAIRFSARVTSGNADLRESFQVILMARYKTATVKMLAPSIKPFPVNKPKELGRWVVVMGEEALIMRAPLVSADQAQEWATSGVECAASPWSVRSGGLTTQRPNAYGTLGNYAGFDLAGPSGASLPVIEGEAVEIQPKKLSDLWEELHDTIDETITLNVLRMASKDPESNFPAAVGGTKNLGWTYDPESVRIWTRKRHAQRAITASRRGRS
jgi:hypothetical protein